MGTASEDKNLGMSEDKGTYSHVIKRVLTRRLAARLGVSAHELSWYLLVLFVNMWLSDAQSSSLIGPLAMPLLNASVG
jgi:hypothetical protein